MRKKTRIAIVGTGNAGCAHAFKLAEAGFSIALIKTSKSIHEDNFVKLLENKGIYGIDSTRGDKEKTFQKIDLITRDLSEGLRGADIVFIMTQSLQHKAISSLIIPYIDPLTKLLLVVPGNLGSLFFFNNIEQNSNIIVAEGESTPYDARIIKPGVVNILFKNVRNAVSFLPKNRDTEGLEILNNLIPTYVGVRTNIVESALHNPNLVVHTIGVIMSASRIEMMKGEFWMYKESFSPAIWNLIRQLDREKNSVIEKFGGQAQSYLDACKYRNEENLDKSSIDVFHTYANSGGPKGPDSLNTRYLYEDVQLGLCTLAYLGELSCVETPVTKSLITIASYLVNYDFDKNKRTLNDFGLDESFEKFKIVINS